jgi:SAM-dependent methyltransferase
LFKGNCERTKPIVPVKKMQGSTSETYSRNWDQFYRSVTSGGEGAPLWEVPAEQAVGLDCEIFEKEFQNGLPVIDLGCGLGTQTVFLSTRFPKVIGMDVSAKAVELASLRYQSENLGFVAIDERDPEFFGVFHEQNGDSNVYLRGVMHQILDNDLPGFIQNLKLLMGTRGKLFFMEVADDIIEHLESSSPSFSQLPGLMKRALLSNLPPRGLNFDSVRALFPENCFTMLALGRSSLNTNLLIGDGEPLRIPAVFGMMGSASTAGECK